MNKHNIATKSNWSLNCKEATLLTELSKEGKLSVLLKIRLWYHLTICISCRQFQKQTLLLAERMKQIGKNNPENKHALPDAEKHRLQQHIEKALAEKNKPNHP